MITPAVGLLYFDTNIYDCRDGLREEEAAPVLAALANRGIRIVMGLDCFEECLIGLESAKGTDEKKILRELRRLIDWSGLRRIAKPTDLMLLDDVRAYVATGQPSGPFLEGTIYQRAVCGELLICLKISNSRQTDFSFTPTNAFRSGLGPYKATGGRSLPQGRATTLVRYWALRACTGRRWRRCLRSRRGLRQSVPFHWKAEWRWRIPANRSWCCHWP